jgi:hypothetical protein
MAGQKKSTQDHHQVHVELHDLPGSFNATFLEDIRENLVNPEY